MTIVGLFTYRQYVIYTYRSYVCNVGALKVANLHCSRQQCIVVEWSGRSVAVSVRVNSTLHIFDVGRYVGWGWPRK